MAFCHGKLIFKNPFMMGWLFINFAHISMLYTISTLSLELFKRFIIQNVQFTAVLVIDSELNK